MIKTTCFLAVSAIVALGSSTAFGAVTLLDDDFNNDDLTINPDTGGGFGFLDNGVNAGTGSITESGSQARIVEGSGSNTSGILSSNAFNLSNSNLSYTVTWNVAQWTSAGSGTSERRTFFTLQSNSSWLFSTAEAEASRIFINIDERQNRASLTYQNRTESAITNFATTNFSLDSGFAGDADGFTATLTLDSTGYSFTTLGLATTNQVNLSGTWADLGAGTDFTTALGTDGPIHVGAFIQNGNVTGAQFDIDRITLTAVGATPQPIALKIFRNGANLGFEWNSQSGKLYKLASSEDLSTAITSWPTYNDGVTTYENIAPSGTGINTLNNVIPLGPRRFFAVIEK
jgi:hypothetical protein